MKKVFLILFHQVFIEYSSCQNTAWKEVEIDKFLTISLPQEVSISDTFAFIKEKKYDLKVFRAELNSSIVGMTIIQTDVYFNPYESESYNEGYEGTKNGCRRSAESKGFTVDIKDTVVDHVKCFKVEQYADDSRTIVSSVGYGFCVNTVTYMIFASPIDNSIDENTENLKKIIKSIRFNREEILTALAVANADPTLKKATALSEDTTLYDKSERIGRALAPIILLIGIAIFVIYKNRKKSASNQSVRLNDDINN